MDIPDSGKSKYKGPEAGKHIIFSRKLSVAWWRQWSTVKLKVGCYRACRVWLTMLRDLHVMPHGTTGSPGPQGWHDQVCVFGRSLRIHVKNRWKGEGGFRKVKLNFKSTGAWNTPSKDAKCLWTWKLAAVVDAQRAAEASRPKNPLLSEAHLPHLYLLSMLFPLSETAWFWVGMEKKELQTPPHLSVG